MNLKEFNDIYRDIIEKNISFWLRSYVKVLIRNGHEFIDCKKMSEDTDVIDDFVHDIYNMYMFLKLNPTHDEIDHYLSDRNPFINKFSCFEIFATHEPVNLIDIFIYKKILIFVQSNLI